MIFLPPKINNALRVWIVTCLLLVQVSEGWKQCLEEEGMACPQAATCCNVGIPGVSGCVTTKRRKDPEGQGSCCSNGTGCGFGYECAIYEDTGEPYCKSRRSDNPQEKNQRKDIPRYELCTVPSHMQQYYGFPIRTNSGETVQAAYLSNMGPINNVSDAHIKVENVLIIIHGSGRTADDYLCGGLSIVPDDSTTLVIAPRFAAVWDEPTLEDQLVWAIDKDNEHPVFHSWRYGGDALNAEISSYEVLDKLVEYVVKGSIQFPSLQRISIFGHSAGGQLTHRWALLSDSPAWDVLRADIRVIVANPKSFVYPDGRRFDDQGNYTVPSTNEKALCPNYNRWLWGLESGGYISCPYKDRSVAAAGGPSQLYERYAKRNVIYLSGEFDTLPPSKKPQCESTFQGMSRLERSEKYFQALEIYYGRPVHSRHVIPRSDHDHMLMLQSDQGRRAIFGPNDDV